MIKIIVSAKMDSMIIVQPPANPANIHAKIVLVQVLVYLVQIIITEKVTAVVKMDITTMIPNVNNVLINANNVMKMIVKFVQIQLTEILILVVTVNLDIMMMDQMLIVKNVCTHVLNVLIKTHVLFVLIIIIEMMIAHVNQVIQT